MSRLLSVNLGQPTEIAAGKRTVITSIFKTPTADRVAVHRENVEGDRQSDLRVHGGPYKAVYAYPSEHYAYWAAEFPGMSLPFGAFGENLTSSGLTEENVAIGERFRIASAVFEITQPRMPCFKLALRFGRSDMVKKFWNSGYSGFYFLSCRKAKSVRETKLRGWQTQRLSESRLRTYLGCTKAKCTIRMCSIEPYARRCAAVGRATFASAGLPIPCLCCEPLPFRVVSRCLSEHQLRRNLQLPGAVQVVRCRSGC